MASLRSTYDPRHADTGVFAALLAARKEYGGKKVVLHDADDRKLTYDDIVRAVFALVMVSMVVKVFDAMMNSVVAGFSRSSTEASAAPSTLETKCSRGRAFEYGASASHANLGPRSEPPMPMWRW